MTKSTGKKLTMIVFVVYLSLIQHFVLNVNDKKSFSNSSYSVILESDPQQVVHRVALRVSSLFLFFTLLFRTILNNMAGLCRF